MPARVRSKLTYANVVSTLCLFVLLGGGAYAGVRLSRNSVGTRQLKNGAVTQVKISAAAQAALKGQKGDPGPGATTFQTTLAQGAFDQTIMALPNGLSILGSCQVGPSVGIRLKPTSGLSNMQISGTGSAGSTLFPQDGTGLSSALNQDPAKVDFDVIARDSTVGSVDRLDLHGEFGTPCTYRGMITPSN